MLRETTRTTHPARQSKRCSTCQRHLAFDAFHRRGHYVRSGVRASCKDCTREANRRARAAGKGKPDPAKQKVRQLTLAAIAAGELIPKPCEVCGAAEVQAHHPSYDGPDAYRTVVYLCVGCHAAEHGKRDWTRQMELFAAR